MLSSETKRRIDSCRDILVGQLPLPTDQVELITLALIYKFMDDLDEQSVQLGGKRSFFIKDLADFRWRSLMPQTVSAADRVRLFADGLEALGDPKTGKHLPEMFRDIFRNAMLKFRDGRILSLFLTELDGFAYSHSEELGNAFEYLLQSMGAQGENGQFRTPRHIIDFIVEVLEPKPEDKILDPACGTGGFLVSAYKHILGKHTSKGSSVPGDQLSPAKKEKLTQQLNGYDITPMMVKLSKVNMFLHGFSDPQIHEYDTLSNDARWNEKYDLIMANPPFMTPKGGVVPHTKFRIAAKKAEVLFSDYIAEHLTTNGRAGIIVPNGIVATTQNAHVKLRRYLVEEALVAVVTLPAGVFKPYSGVKTSILILDKERARQNKEILFLRITADGFDLGDKRNPIEANDLPESKRVLKAWLEGTITDDFATSLGWKRVPKNELLAKKTAILATERFLSETGKVSEEHPSVRLGDVADYVRGLTYGKGDETEMTTKNIVLRAQNVSVEDSRLVLDDIRYLRPDFEGVTEKRLRADDILVCSSSGSKAHMGKVAFVTSDLPYFFGGFMGVLRSRPERIEPRFLFRLLTSQHHKAFLAGLTEGANINNLKLNEYLDYEIPLPPLEVQKEIVAEIEGYQRVIDGARAVVENYKPHIPIDPKWPVVELGDLCKPEYGFTESALDKGDARFIRITDISADGKLKQDEAKYVALTDEARESLLSKGDILVARTGATFGKTMLFNESYPAVFASFLIRLRFSSDKILPEFYWAFAQSLSYWTQARKLMTGGGQPQFNGNAIIQVKLPVPSLEEQRNICSEHEKEQAMVNANKELIALFEKKIQTVMDRVWGNGTAE
jgi:type I restriction enzyme M protein